MAHHRERLSAPHPNIVRMPWPPKACLRSHRVRLLLRIAAFYDRLVEPTVVGLLYTKFHYGVVCPAVLYKPGVPPLRNARVLAPHQCLDFFRLLANWGESRHSVQRIPSLPQQQVHTHRRL
jgi:hypothetical protein